MMTPPTDLLKFSIKILFQSFTFIVMLLFLSGSTNYAFAQDSEKEPRSGGELHIAYYNLPKHLNPAILSGQLTGNLGAQLFAGLLRMDRNWRPHPYLAERWEASADGLTYTFTIRQGATFHDGKPITSADVAFSIQTVKEHHPFSTMLAAVERVETPDSFTAVVYLKHPHPALELVAASPMLPIIPKHVYGDGRDLKTHPANWQVVGSGPFKLGSLTDKKIIFDKYDDFFLKGKPYLDRIVVSIMSRDAVSVALETGAVHLQGFSLDEHLRRRLPTIKHLKADKSPYAGIGALEWLAFNLEKPPFDDMRVRQAVGYAIDRELMVKASYEDLVSIATGPICPGTPFYTDEVETYDIDVDRANILLDEAGYPRDSKGERFETTLDVIPTTVNRTIDMARYIAKELYRKLGIKVVVKQYNSIRDWMDQVSNRRFSMTIDSVYNFGDPVIGVHRTYSSRNIRKGVIWSNTQAYRNAKVDALMDAAGREVDFNKRKALYKEFQQIIARELPVYGLVQSPHATVYHRDLANMTDTIWGTMFPFTDVYWKK